MKRKRHEPDPSEMRPEYDFSGGVRGKYYRRYLDDAWKTIITRRVVSVAAVRRAMRSILRDMPGAARGRESIRAKLKAVRRRG